MIHWYLQTSEDSLCVVDSYYANSAASYHPETLKAPECNWLDSSAQRWQFLCAPDASNGKTRSRLNLMSGAALKRSAAERTLLRKILTRRITE
jgi:hypothetical protein